MSQFSFDILLHYLYVNFFASCEFNSKIVRNETMAMYFQFPSLLFRMSEPVISCTGNGRFSPLPIISSRFRSDLATGFRHIPCRTRSGEIPTDSVLEVVGNFPAKIARESGSMESVGTRRIRPIPTGTDRNNPPETGSESDCKDPAVSDRVAMTSVAKIV
jgi:hypothetical protein